ncbi:MAG: hypothetical protein HYV24_07820 [Deltaproteobacteria bacterium]|nr:hypothetical protein [Deltaproteobacteria bacterium]
MDTIETEQYREELVKAIQKHGIEPGVLEFVDEIPNDPRRASRVYKIEKRILIKKSIPREDKGANIEFLFAKFPDEVAKLEDDFKFVKQLVLYEMFHIVYRYQTDYECAKWAFYHLNK